MGPLGGHLQDHRHSTTAAVSPCGHNMQRRSLRRDHGRWCLRTRRRLVVEFVGRRTRKPQADVETGSGGRSASGGRTGSGCRSDNKKEAAATEESTTLCMYFVCVGRNDFGGRYSQAGSSRSSSSWWKKMATKMATEIMKMATEIMKMAPTASC